MTDIHTDFGGPFQEGTKNQVRRAYTTLQGLLAGKDFKQYGYPQTRYLDSTSFDIQNAISDHNNYIASGEFPDQNVFTFIIDPSTGQKVDGNLHRDAYITVFEKDGKINYNIGPNTGVHNRPNVIKAYKIDQDLINWIALGASAKDGAILAGPPVWQGGATYGPATGSTILTRNPLIIADEVDLNTIVSAEEYQEYIQQAIDSVPFDSLVDTLQVYEEQLNYPISQSVPFKEGDVDHNGNLTFNTAWAEMKDPTKIAGFSFRGKGKDLFYLPLTFSYLPDDSMKTPSKYGMLASWGYSDGIIQPLGKPWIESYVFAGKFQTELAKALKEHGLKLEDISDVRVHAYPNDVKRPEPFLEYEKRLATNWNTKMYEKFQERIETIR